MFDFFNMVYKNQFGPDRNQELNFLKILIRKKGREIFLKEDECAKLVYKKYANFEVSEHGKPFAFGIADFYPPLIDVKQEVFIMKTKEKYLVLYQKTEYFEDREKVSYETYELTKSELKFKEKEFLEGFIPKPYKKTTYSNTRKHDEFWRWEDAKFAVEGPELDFDVMKQEPVFPALLVLWEIKRREKMLLPIDIKEIEEEAMWQIYNDENHRYEIDSKISEEFWLGF